MQRFFVRIDTSGRRTCNFFQVRTYEHFTSSFRVSDPDLGLSRLVTVGNKSMSILLMLVTGSGRKQDFRLTGNNTALALPMMPIKNEIERVATYVIHLLTWHAISRSALGSFTTIHYYSIHFRRGVQHELGQDDPCLHVFFMLPRIRPLQSKNDRP